MKSEQWLSWKKGQGHTGLMWQPAVTVAKLTSRCVREFFSDLNVRFNPTTVKSKYNQPVGRDHLGQVHKSWLCQLTYAMVYSYKALPELESFYKLSWPFFLDSPGINRLIEETNWNCLLILHIHISHHRSCLLNKNASLLGFMWNTWGRCQWRGDDFEGLSNRFNSDMHISSGDDDEWGWIWI